ncbi:MAG TPA: hydrogenase maturation protease [Acetobacteraceae bacterium]|nr:hydrogenase maturation protease [Acetobacteraceae bacterium]
MTGEDTRKTAARRVLVVGIGNPERGDDGVGPAVAHRLAGRLPGDVGLIVQGGDMLSLLGDWAGVDALVCVDAAVSGASPGQIHRLDLAADELPRDLAPVSSHAFGLPEAIALARALGEAPRRIVIYAIEGRCFDGGAAMSPEAVAAAEAVAGHITAEIARLRQPERETAQA